MTRFLLTIPLLLALGCSESDEPAASASPAPAAPAAEAPAEAPARADMAHGDGMKGDMPHAEGEGMKGDMPHAEGEGMKGDMPMYACPMHPDITSNEPGDCSKCGMALEMQEGHDHGSHDHGEAAAGSAGEAAKTEAATGDGHDDHDH